MKVPLNWLTSELSLSVLDGRVSCDVVLASHPGSAGTVPQCFGG